MNYWKQYRIPVPPQKVVLKLEKLKEYGKNYLGANVIYPKAPWFDEYQAQHEQSEKKIKEEYPKREKKEAYKIIKILK